MVTKKDLHLKSLTKQVHGIDQRSDFISVQSDLDPLHLQKSLFSPMALTDLKDKKYKT